MNFATTSVTFSVIAPAITIPNNRNWRNPGSGLEEMEEKVSEPKRIQRKRGKGWKMPEGAVYVGRPTRFGNNFTVAEYGRDLAVFNFRQRMRNMALINPSFFDAIRGKDLACWCPLDQPCHADVLLKIANAKEEPPHDPQG